MQEPAGNGREGTVVCLHPPCLTSRLFAGIEEQLGGNHQVIRWDIRGHGRSDGGSARMTLAMIAEDMRALLDGLGVKRAYVCAYGAGSFPALTALLLHPQRFIGGMLLSGSAAYTDILSRSKLQAAYISSILAPKAPIAFKAAWSEARTRSEFEELHEETKLGDPAKWRDYAAACLEDGLERRIRQIKQPMLLLYGTKDAIGGNYAVRLHRLLPNSELYGINGATSKLAMNEPVTTSFVMSRWMAKQEHPELADTHDEREALLQELAEHGVKAGNDSGRIQAQPLRNSLVH
ncbi:alpha/beta hydrolase [Paenibacillus rhizovicinus]|uniref:Alpha/beta hydrolase n=1 Tax=Paenibacillus rhizovicinus TaxID=2704463 RepID=A0A6C0NWY4_9BACL|nr:alpha/beta hydrolase [Paenibacillus rhizovicinus]QHW30730.1 alpha/beta hydrolase [Paenibacillus rhizovicinus]